MRRDLEQHEAEKQKRNARATNLRHAIEEIIAHTDNGVVVTVFLYEEYDLVPFACKGMAYVEWVLEATGKHEHGFTRGVFDSGEMTQSVNIQEEPNAANRLLLIKHELMAYCGILLVSKGIKYGVVCFMGHKPGRFNLFQRAGFLRAAHRISGVLAAAQAKK